MSLSNHSLPVSGWKPRYSVSECLALLGVSKGFFYGRVRSGHYQVVKDGTRTFMTYDELIRAASCGREIGSRPDSPSKFVDQ